MPIGTLPKRHRRANCPKAKRFACAFATHYKRATSVSPHSAFRFSSAKAASGTPLQPHFKPTLFTILMLHPHPLLSLVLSALSLCGFAQGKQSAQLTLFVGTYTEDSPSEGIYVFHFNQETGHFSLRSSAKAGNPSFVVLSPNGNRLYAVSEFNDGRQGAYSFDFDPKTGQLSNPIFASTKAGDKLIESFCSILSVSMVANTA